MTEARQTTQSAFGAALAAIVIGAALGVFGTVRVYSNDTRIAETYAAKSELAGILGSITDAETGQRGFVITGDPSYLQPYTDGVAQVEQTLTTLDAMLRDNPAQQASLSLLRVGIGQKLQELAQSIQLRRTDGFDAAQKLVRTNSGQVTMDRIRTTVATMDREEDVQLETRRRASAGSLRIAVVFELVTALTALGLVAIAARASRRRLLEADARGQLARRLAAIVDSSDDAIIGKDLTGTVTSWNSAAERIFGYSAAEMQGQSIRLIIPSDRQREEDHVLESLRRGESVAHFETVRQRKDGAPIPISLTVSPIRDDGGRVIGASKIARDITERRRADAALSDLRQRLVTLVAASGSLLQSPRVDDVLPATIAIAHDLVAADGYCVWRLDAVDHRWRVVASDGISGTFANQVVAAFQQDGVSTLPFSEPLAVEDVQSAPLLEERREAYRAEGIQSMLAVPLVVGGRATRTLAFYYYERHVFNEVEVQTARALGNLAATALNAAELYDDQRHHHERAEFLAQAGSALGSALDYDVTLKAVANLAVPTMADWCAVDIVDDGGELRRLAVAHVDPTKLELAQTLRERYPEDPSSPYGVHHVIRTGESVMLAAIPEELLAASVRDAEHLRVIRALGLTSYMCVPLLVHGRAVGALTFVTAESQRHYADADLRFAEQVAARASLAVANARAYEVSRRLAETLSRATREAEQANRLKDEFLATLSHELRTPLNAILGYARILRTGAIDPERQTRALEVLERNATALSRIVEDVLDVSRIITGKTRLDVQPVDVVSVIDHAVATVRPAADAKGVRLQTVLDRQTAPISGDADRLQQVIWNLLSNAVKFTARGGRVQVQLVRVNSHVEIVVSDTGIGIAPEFLPHVFDRFRQADSQFSRQHGGLGLGLAICRHLVELHGGLIYAASDGEGTGATFRVHLPVMIVHADRSLEGLREHPRAERGTIEPARGRLNGVHVFAVDDEGDALTLLREILEQAGAEVTTLSSAEEAMDAMEARVPDALITDIGMPGTDGFELIRRIRQSPDGAIRAVPVAALTAYARSEDRTRTLRSGFQLHLSKPIDPGELVAAVEALVRRGQFLH